jgi:hypothetical protein
LIRSVGKGSLSVAFFLLVSAAGHARSEAPGSPAVFDPAGVRVGMRATAYTVLQGDTVDRFEVELLGVVPGTRPKGDLILFRALGDSLLRTGIVAGMSGSPVYIEDNLLGAIAFAFSFSKEPIGLITPITEMLEGMERIAEPPAPWMGAPGVVYDSFHQSFLMRTNNPEAWEALVPTRPEGMDGRSLVALSASGWEQDLQPSLERFAIRAGLPPPTSAFGGTVPMDPAPELKPGSIPCLRPPDVPGRSRGASSFESLDPRDHSLACLILQDGKRRADHRHDPAGSARGGRRVCGTDPTDAARPGPFSGTLRGSSL